MALFIKKIIDNREWKPILALTTVFVLSRIVFHFAGVIFYGEFVRRLWQVIDVELLKSSLLQSLFYSHAQPPLFNLLCGVVLKIFPNHYSLVFHVLFLAIGWLNAVVLYLSFRKCNLSVVFSFGLPAVFLLLPSVVLYENIFSYTYVVVFLLTLLVYLLILFTEGWNQKYWFAFCCALALLVLSRSFYHPLWMVSIIGIAFFLIRDKEHRPKILYAAMPTFFVFLWLLKNFLVFGTFSTSSWMGMNMARIMSPSTSLGEIGPFKPIDQYPVDLSDCYPDVTMLHEVYKIGGFVNYHHIGYIEVSKQFSRDVTDEIQNHPLEYLSRVRDAVVIYFNPASHAPFIDKNYLHIKRYASIANLDFSGYDKFKKDHFSFLYAMPVMLLHALLFAGVVYCFRKKLFTRKDQLVIIVMIFILGYAMTAGNFLEYGENNRFRFEHLTVFVLLAAKVAGTIFRNSILADYSSDAI